jgi:outer membrane protein OmpA-like peptidoglycan-associated protein
LVVALVWAVAALISCPEDPATCSLSNTPDMSQYVNERVEQSRQRMNEVFRPDRDAEDIAGQDNDTNRPPTLSVDQAVRTPDKVFRCVDETGKRRRNHQIYMGEGALFELNQASLNEVEARPQLVKLGELIRRHPDANITIVGHADKAPHKDGPRGNLIISEQRASAVADWLVDNGYAKAEKISAMGVGDRYPMVEVQEEAQGERRNRRVEVRVQCPMESR